MEKTKPQFHRGVIHLKEPLAYGEDKTFKFSLEEVTFGLMGGGFLVIVDNKSSEQTMIPVSNVRSWTLFPKAMLVN